jgi:predicted GNAT family acetyltransferase
MTTSERIGVTVIRNEDRRRYEALTGASALAGFVEYREARESVVLVHTEVDPSFAGRGVASSLARGALDDLRDRGLQALVVCPFLHSWLRRHPEYSDVLFHAPPALVRRDVAT